MKMEKVYKTLVELAKLSLDIIGSLALGATVCVGSYNIINKICPEEMKALAALGCAIVSTYVTLDKLLMKYRLEYLEDELKTIENVSRDRVNRVYDRIREMYKERYNKIHDNDKIYNLVREIYDKIHDIEANIYNKIYNLEDQIYHLKNKVYMIELKNSILEYKILKKQK